MFVQPSLNRYGTLSTKQSALVQVTDAAPAAAALPSVKIPRENKCPVVLDKLRIDVQQEGPRFVVVPARRWPVLERCRGLVRAWERGVLVERLWMHVNRLSDLETSAVSPSRTDYTPLSPHTLGRFNHVAATRFLPQGTAGSTPEVPARPPP